MKSAARNCWLLLTFLAAPTTPLAAATPSKLITGLTLFDAASNVDLRALADQDTIDLSAYPNLPLTIRADVLPTSGATPAAIISQVAFDLDDGATIRTETMAPYFLGATRQARRTLSTRCR